MHKKNTGQRKYIETQAMSVAALFSMGLLSACGGSGNTGTVQNTQSDLDTASNTFQDDETLEDVDVSNLANVAPSARGVPDTVSSDSDLLGKIYIFDENPDTVDVSVTTSTNFPVLISDERVLSIDFENIEAENEPGTVHTFTIVLIDEKGLQSQETFTITAIDLATGPSDSLDAEYEVDDEGLELSISLDQSSFKENEAINGMQFDLSFDPEVLSIDVDSLISNYFPLFYMNDELADQGIVTFVGITLDDRPNFNIPLLDIQFAILQESVTTDLNFLNVEVGQNEFMDSTVSLIV